METNSTHIDQITSSGQGRENGIPARRHVILLVCVALIGLIISVMLYWTLSEQKNNLAHAEFQLLAEKRVEAIRQAIADRLSVLSLFKSFYAGSMDVNQNEFKTFSDSILKDSPDIKLLAWIPQVPGQERAAHEDEVKEMGNPQYGIKRRSGNNFVPAGPLKQYFPLQFVAPHEKYRTLLGFDLGTLRDCLDAMNRSKSTAGPAITYASLPEVQSDSETLLNVFEAANTELPNSDNAAKPTRNSQGFILGVFSLDELTAKVSALMPLSGVDAYFFDVTNPDRPTHILSQPSLMRTTVMPKLQAPPPDSSSAMHYTTQISAADRTWLIYCTPCEAYYAGKTEWEPLWAMLSSMLITGLVVAYLILLSDRTASVEKLIAQRTKEYYDSEQRFRILVENAADGFILHDEVGKIFDANQMASEQLGYSREELLKMNVFDFEVAFKPDDHHEMTWRKPANEYPITVHGTHRRKDGSTYPAEIHINCFESGGNRMIMAVVRDITERKQAEESLRKEQMFLRHLIDLQERERKLVSYEIHDGLAQQLTAASYKLQALEAAMDRQTTPNNKKLLDESMYIILGCMDEARRLIGGLRPPILDEMGVIAAIDYLISEWHESGSPQIEFVHKVNFNRLAPPLEVALFRIAQECLTNACRHSQTTRISVELKQLENYIRLTVQDWGTGFDHQKVKGNHFGLRGIYERARLMGGIAEIDSSIGRGTTVKVDLPLLKAYMDENGSSEND